MLATPPQLVLCGGPACCVVLCCAVVVLMSDDEVFAAVLKDAATTRLSFPQDTHPNAARQPDFGCVSPVFSTSVSPLPLPRPCAAPMYVKPIEQALKTTDQLLKNVRKHLLSLAGACVCVCVVCAHLLTDTPIRSDQHSCRSPLVHAESDNICAAI